ncbi:RidA family protein [Micromonospora sp. KC723]|uniref:RidA family protein n=1 Tax=Micromonospora sp. KC723 TaxID=2530381 RepID=UPI00104BD8AC|nr:RidA family protein [Micromonospora sp. KC723]
MGVRHINPEGLHRNATFSQAVVVEKPTKTIYIGGQDGVDANGKVVGSAAGEQVGRCSATSRPLWRARGRAWRTSCTGPFAVVECHSFDEGVAAFRQVWNPADPPPVITVHVVASLNPGFVVEIDAVAVV